MKCWRSQLLTKGYTMMSTAGQGGSDSAHNGVVEVLLKSGQGLCEDLNNNRTFIEDYPDNNSKIIKDKTLGCLLYFAV